MFKLVQLDLTVQDAPSPTYSNCRKVGSSHSTEIPSTSILNLKIHPICQDNSRHFLWDLSPEPSEHESSALTVLQL